MKQKLAELLSRNIIADITVMRCVQGCCFMTAALVFGLGIWKLAHVDLTAAQIVMGIVWTTFLPLLLAGSGLLLPMLLKREDELN
jgi:hypothetical protein